MEGSPDGSTNGTTAEARTHNLLNRCARYGGRVFTGGRNAGASRYVVALSKKNASAEKQKDENKKKRRRKTK